MTSPANGGVRVKVVCLFTDDDRLLAIDGFDPTKQQRFWVPVGGGVEFGELSKVAVVREVAEELSAEITDVELLGVLENLFTFDGEAGHEIVFVYDARFVDRSFYQRGTIGGIEGGNPYTAHWINPAFPANGWPLRPHGLADLIDV